MGASCGRSPSCAILAPTATTERMVADGRPMEITRIRITEAGAL